MDHLVQTPTILLRVLEYVDLPTLLHAHLINKPIHDLIVAYGKSICSAFVRHHYHDLFSERPLPEQRVSSIKQLAKLGRQRDLADLLAKETKIRNEPGELSPTHHQRLINQVRGEIRELVESHWGVVWRAQDVGHGIRHSDGHWTFEQFSALQPHDTASSRMREVDYLCHGLGFIQDTREGVRRYEAIALDVYGLILLDEVLDRLRSIRFWYEPGDEGRW